MTTPKPPRGPVSTELAGRMGAVREAFAKIRDNHLAWILNAATAHFAKEVEDTEAEIVRYERLPDAPIYTTYGRAREGAAPRTRAEELPRLRARLEEYHAILEFLEALRAAENVRSAEVLAADLRDSGFFAPRPRRPPRGAGP